MHACELICLGNKENNLTERGIKVDIQGASGFGRAWCRAVFFFSLSVGGDSPERQAVMTDASRGDYIRIDRSEVSVSLLVQ